MDTDTLGESMPEKYSENVALNGHGANIYKRKFGAWAHNKPKDVKKPQMIFNNRIRKDIDAITQS